MKDSVKLFLSMIMPYQPIKRSAAHFDDQYRRGTWDYLWSLDEAGRYSVLIGYCRDLRPKGALLEIGSGEGVLQHRLDPTSYIRYVGVDISEAAVGRARGRTANGAIHDSPRVEFVVADASSYMPTGQFDLIVFNESLYYFDDPLALVRRYEPFLAGNGLFIASIHRDQDSVRWKRIWRGLDSVYRTYDVTTVTNAKATTWDIRVFAPLGHE